MKLISPRVMLAAIAALSAVQWSATASDAAPLATQLLTFRDHRSELVLTIEAAPLAPNAGEFSLRTPDGVFVSVGRAVLSQHSKMATTARYEGESTLIRPSGEAGTVNVRLQAQLDPAHHSAQASLWTANADFHLVATKPKASGREEILQGFETAFASNDWDAVYDILSSEMRAEYGAQDFVELARSQQAQAGVFLALERRDVGPIQTNPAGITFFAATYDIVRSLAGTTQRDTYAVYFVLEDDAWRLWFTAQD